MTRSVGNVGYEPVVRCALWAKFIQDGANFPDDFDIGWLVATANIVGFARPALFQNKADGLAVVFHVQPVANLFAIPVDRQGLAALGRSGSSAG